MSVPDPSPKHQPGGGNIQYKDYTKDVTWTPIKISLLILFTVIPYLGLITAIYLLGTKFLAYILIGITFLLAFVVGLLYWVAKA